MLNYKDKPYAIYWQKGNRSLWRADCKKCGRFQKRRDLIVKSLNDIDNITCIKPKGDLCFSDFSSYLNTYSNGKLIADTFDISEYLLREARVVTVLRRIWRNGHIRFSYAVSSKLLKGNGQIKSALNKLSK